MEEEQVTFEDYLRVIYERKWIIVIAFFAVIISTAIFTFRQTPVYEATCTIMVESKASQQPIFDLGYPTRVNTENYSEILKSRTVAEHTLEKVAGSDFSILQAENPVKSFLNRLKITSVRNTDILKISVGGKTPLEASVLANTVADVLIELELTTGRKRLTEQKKFLGEQIPIVRERLEKIENDLKKFKEKTGLVALSEETKQLTEKLLEFDRLHGEVESEFESQKTRLASLEADLEETQGTLVEKISQISSPYILALRKQLIDLETTYSMYLVQGLPEKNPKLVGLRKSIEETKTKITEETNKIKNKEIPTLNPLSYSQKLVDEIISLRTEVAADKAKLNTLGGVIKEYEKRMQRLPAQELHLVELEREREINANTYKLLMERHEEVRIAEVGEIANVRIIDRAKRSQEPVKPKKKLNLAVGVIVGLILGFGGAFLSDYVDTSVKTASDVEKFMGVPIIGSIPDAKLRNKANSEFENIKLHLITHYAPKSTMSEAYRALRTNLQFMNPDNPPHAILVTSSAPKEGKTTVATNLALCLAQMGGKTLLVDTDLRKPMITKLFDIKKKRGLTEILSGEFDKNSAIVETNIENLSIIPSGAIPPNPSELLGSQRMKSLIKNLRRDFDYIIFDSPPIIAVTDAAILATEVDGALCVLRMGKTDRRAATRAREILNGVGANLMGVVLNMVPMTRRGYGYSHYYYYYDYGEKKKKK